MKTFGSDPEFLLTLNDFSVSAIGKIKGTIENRLNINGHQFYSDNVLAECAINPGKSKDEVLENFKNCFQIYSKMIRPYKLAVKASEIFPEEELLHEDARRVGCAKEFCAYEMKQQESPISEISQNNLRSCGGHIHIGSDILAGDGPEPVLMVYLLDLFLGVPSLWLDKDLSSPRRRNLYGKAGRYRPKSYGIEYRSLGNFWLNSPDLVDLVYDITMFCVSFIEKGDAWNLWEFDIDRFIESDDLSKAWICKAYDCASLREGINSSDKNRVKSHMEFVSKILPKKINKKIKDNIDQTMGDFYKNWNII